ncbi:DNA-binding protein [Betaproteobacteria bacterium]|nr:DNA-binding protein [Betaproteobacteria bacterium]GHU13832.1 DNA-binding protein [Betaproteobacteria bacterium]
MSSFSLQEIELAILTLRGQRVLLSNELAKLYGVEPRTLMQAVKRNIDRFPEDFMFQLSAEERHLVVANHLPSNLKSQIVISSHATSTSKHGGVRHAPYAFTEQGVAMLSSVLRSPEAVQANIEIMRAFVRLRRILSEHQELARRIDELEGRYDQQFRSVFDAIRQLMTPPAIKKNPIGFTADISTKDQTTP